MCSDFLSGTYEQALSERIQQKVRVWCCDSDLCNGPYSSAGAAEVSAVVIALSQVIAVAWFAAG